MGVYRSDPPVRLPAPGIAAVLAVAAAVAAIPAIPQAAYLRPVTPPALVAPLPALFLPPDPAYDFVFSGPQVGAAYRRDVALTQLPPVEPPPADEALVPAAPSVNSAAYVRPTTPLTVTIAPPALFLPPDPPYDFAFLAAPAVAPYLRDHALVLPPLFVPPLDNSWVPIGRVSLAAYVRAAAPTVIARRTLLPPPVPLPMRVLLLRRIDPRASYPLPALPKGIGAIFAVDAPITGLALQPAAAYVRPRTNELPVLAGVGALLTPPDPEYVYAGTTLQPTAAYIRSWPALQPLPEYVLPDPVTTFDPPPQGAPLATAYTRDRPTTIVPAPFTPIPDDATVPGGAAVDSLAQYTRTPAVVFAPAQGPALFTPPDPLYVYSGLTLQPAAAYVRSPSPLPSPQTTLLPPPVPLVVGLPPLQPAGAYVRERALTQLPAIDAAPVGVPTMPAAVTVSLAAYARLPAPLAVAAPPPALFLPPDPIYDFVFARGPGASPYLRSTTPTRLSAVGSPPAATDAPLPQSQPGFAAYLRSYPLPPPFAVDAPPAAAPVDAPLPQGQTNLAAYLRAPSPASWLQAIDMAPPAAADMPYAPANVVAAYLRQPPPASWIWSQDVAPPPPDAPPLYSPVVTLAAHYRVPATARPFVPVLQPPLGASIPVPLTLGQLAYTRLPARIVPFPGWFALFAPPDPIYVYGGMVKQPPTCYTRPPNLPLAPVTRAIPAAPIPVPVEIRNPVAYRRYDANVMLPAPKVLPRIVPYLPPAPQPSLIAYWRAPTPLPALPDLATTDSASSFPGPLPQRSNAYVRPVYALPIPAPRVTTDSLSWYQGGGPIQDPAAYTRYPTTIVLPVRHHLQGDRGTVPPILRLAHPVAPTIVRTPAPASGVLALLGSVPPTIPLRQQPATQRRDRAMYPPVTVWRPLGSTYRSIGNATGLSTVNGVATSKYRVIGNALGSSLVNGVGVVRFPFIRQLGRIDVFPEITRVDVITALERVDVVAQSVERVDIFTTSERIDVF